MRNNKKRSDRRKRKSEIRIVKVREMISEEDPLQENKDFVKRRLSEGEGS